MPRTKPGSEAIYRARCRHLRTAIVDLQEELEIMKSCGVSKRKALSAMTRATHDVPHLRGGLLCAVAEYWDEDVAKP